MSKCLITKHCCSFIEDIQHWEEATIKYHRTTKHNQQKLNMNKLTSLFRSKSTRTWHSSCKHPNTISFRLRDDDPMFKTVNSVYLDISYDGINTTPDQSFCFFTNSNSCESTSASPEEYSDEESVETVISRVVRSDRLFFQPDQTSSLLQGTDIGVDQVPFKESVALAMESEDPYADFRRSMEEIVECHGLQEWVHLEELLEWYLKVNGKRNHRFIIGAFVDLLVTISSKHNPCDDATSTYSSAVSLISSPSSFSCSCRQIHESDL